MVDERQPAVVGVIEDDAVSRTALGRLLQAGGFEPALFDSAETFVVSPGNRKWLCLIVDVQLTGMSGIDLQRHLRAAGCDVPVIIMTGNRADTFAGRKANRVCGVL
jgi:FixJ family two-component response regulator